jgi:hypothetical protein
VGKRDLSNYTELIGPRCSPNSWVIAGDWECCAPVVEYGGKYGPIRADLGRLLKAPIKISRRQLVRL